MNSSIQCLLCIGELNKYIKNEEYLKIKHNRKKEFFWTLIYNELVKILANNT